MRTQQTNKGVGLFGRLLPSPVLHVGLVLAATALLSSCASAPAEPTSMIDDQANFNDYKTFGWIDPVNDDDDYEPVSIVDTHIRATIKAEMRSKGYVEAEVGTTPDILLDYEAARVEKVKSRPFRIGIGVGGYGSSGAASVNTSTSGTKNVSEGSLVIYAIDSARNAEVWRSRISQELGKDTASSEVIQAVVSEVLSDFPSHVVTEDTAQQ